ncbi:sulfatase-like hydrolase/transferase [Calycomorphotria hydatis]|uniref:Arylsulfatase n=1 Tax=Calycomorphotria hydatis TaxID=2528027 RepID=A0A517T393_9PLAN|nr:sulfatase-like hydrolase/transferase [Calycomorphotria hydatis]QDT62839.1 Arylsulfatase [Calycomorphotria hydatis]
MLRIPISSCFSLLLAISCGSSFASEGQSPRPNIILLLADDLGYADLSSFGSTAVRTPNIDSLAEGGMKWTRFYAAAAVCTPTRASILTGRYPLRFDIRQHFPDDESHLPAGVTTLPGLLQKAGYQTAHIGKWHLGGLHLAHTRDREHSIPGPNQHGFDYYLCQNEEQPLRGKLGKDRRLFRDGGTCLIRNEEQVGPDDPYYRRHFTDINGDEAVAVIDQFHADGRPFFLNLWWLVPHKPYEPAPAPHWENTEANDISDDQHRFRSMVEHMDAKVGKILAKLEQLGIRDNTLIVFTSDNGAAFEGQIGDLKGGKTDLHEGGIRVPMIANWPGEIPAGTKTDVPGVSTDLLPTFCAAAGVNVPEATPLDGENLLPILRDESNGDELRDRLMLWQLDLYRRIQRHYPKPKPYSTEIAMQGEWKLLSESGEPQELFRITDDRVEQTNLLDEHPEVVQRLTKQVRNFLEAPRQRWSAAE